MNTSQRQNVIRAYALISSLLIALMLISTAHAAMANQTAIGIGAGTLGAALDLSRTVDPATTLRVTFGTFDLRRPAAFNNVVIDVQTNLRLTEHFRLQTAGLYVERRIGSSLHLTAGALLNRNTISAVSVAADSSVIINHYAYSAANAGQIFTFVKWMPVAPYVGFGFGPRIGDRRRVAFVAEVGAYYEGPAAVTFDSNGAIRANAALFAPYFTNLENQLSRELSPVEVYPVCQFALRLRM